MMLSLLVWAGLSVTGAHAQIQNEPVEIISAPPPATFSERAGIWPTEKLPIESFTNDRSTMSDRWNTVPSVQSRESGSPTISIRGSALSDRVLQLLDGAPLNMADGAGASTLLIPTEVMSGTSLIKGPASVFYGTSAMAGAIDNRLRYFERPTISGTLADMNGQFGDRRIAFIAPVIAANDKPIAQFSVMRERDPGAYRPSNSMDLFRATLAADLDLHHGWNFTARLIEGTLESSNPGSLYFPSASTLKQNGLLASLQLSRTSEGLVTSLRFTDSRINGEYDGGTTTSFVSRSSLYGDVNVAIGDRLLLRTFGDLTFDHLTASYVGGSSFYENDAGLGQSLQISLSSSWTLQPSYRYESRFGQFLKSLAVVNSTEHWTSSLKVGEGFRTASLTDRFSNFSTFVGNPSLQPEKSLTTELGTSYEGGHRYGGFLSGLGATVDVFYTNFNDLVDTRAMGTNSTRVNAGVAQSIGSEASLAYGMSAWMATASYSYLDARNLSSSEPLTLAPRNQAAFALATLLGPVVLEAKETVWSSFYDRNQVSALVQLAPWQTFDFTMRTIALTDWSVRAGVLNLFNQARELTYGYPEPLRRFYVSADRSF